MGISYTRECGRTQDALVEACRASTGKSNTWVEDGTEYFFEVLGTTEDRDGIFGHVYRDVGKNAEGQRMCRLSSSYIIHGDGSVSGPQWMREAGFRKEVG